MKVFGLEVTGSLKATGNISGSATSTGSFGQLTIGTSNAGYRAKITSNGDVDIRGVDPVQTISFGSNRPAASTTTFNSTNNTTLTLQETEAPIVSLSKTLISGSSVSTGSFGRLNILNEFHTEPGGYLYGDSGNPNLRLSNSSGVKLAYAGVYFQALAASINIVATSEPITIKNDDTSLILTNDNQISGSATSTGSFGRIDTAGSIFSGGDVTLGAFGNTFFFNSNNFFKYNEWRQNTSGDVSINNHGVGSFKIEKSNDALLTVSMSGNVGIGTTSPGGKLEVKQTAASTGLFINQDGNGIAISVDT